MVLAGLCGASASCPSNQGVEEAKDTAGAKATDQDGAPLVAEKPEGASGLAAVLVAEKPEAADEDSLRISPRAKDPDLQRWLLKVLEEKHRASELSMQRQHEQLMVALESRVKEGVALAMGGACIADHHNGVERRAAAAEPAPQGLPSEPTVEGEPYAKAKRDNDKAILVHDVDMCSDKPFECADDNEERTSHLSSPSRLQSGLSAKSAEQVLEWLDNQGTIDLHMPKEATTWQKVKYYATWMMTAPLDIFSGILIAASTCVVFIHLQWQGYEARVALGLELPGEWEWADGTIMTFEYLFATIFLVELILRIAVFRGLFLKDALNIVDSIVVVVTAIDTFILSQAESASGKSLVFTRMIRYAKLVRTLRLFKAMKLCHPLRVLIRTIASSCVALMWSMLLLVVLMMIASFFLCQTLQDFIRDEGQDYDTRLWVENYYGSAAKSMWTMFEITFSGGWPQWVRPVVEGVSTWYAIFFAVYVGAIVFAVIRIITALFLKETLQVAANDTEMMLQSRRKESARFMAALEAIFKEADTSGDGMVTWEEFRCLTNNPRAHAYLASFELELHEVEAMFSLLSDDLGRVSLEEFLGGIMRMKGTARSLDIIMLLHDNKKILNLLESTVGSDEWEQVTQNLSKTPAWKIAVQSQAPGMPMKRKATEDQMERSRSNMGQTKSCPALSRVRSDPPLRSGGDQADTAQTNRRPETKASAGVAAPQAGKQIIKL